MSSTFQMGWQEIAKRGRVRGEADEELQLVVLAQPRAHRLDPRDQLRVHPEGGKMSMSSCLTISLKRCKNIFPWAA